MTLGGACATGIATPPMVIVADRAVLPVLAGME